MKKALFVLTVLLFAVTAFAQEKMRIAIMDLEASGVDQLTANNVSELLRTELFNTGLFRVVERDQMRALLDEQALQAGGCTDTECAVQMGKMLAVQKMLMGTVMKMGTAYIINARIVDVEKAEMEFGDKARANNEEDLERAVSEFAHKLSVRIQRSAAGGGATIPPPPRGGGAAGGSVRPFKTLGLICIGVGAAGVLTGGVLGISSSGAQDKAATAYDDYLAARDETEAGTLWDAYVEQVDQANTLGGIAPYPLMGGGVLVAVGVVAILIKRSPAQNLSASIVPGPRGAAVRLAARF